MVHRYQAAVCLGCEAETSVSAEPSDRNGGAGSDTDTALGYCCVWYA
jgi:hypothetical protein